MKTKMNRFRFYKILILFALTAFSVQAKAQLLEHGFGAEKDNHISVLLRPGETWADVTLGNPNENDQNAQYHWENVKVYPPDATAIFGEGWENKKRPELSLGVGKWLFRVTRASKYGYQTEMVVVDVVNTITVTAELRDDRCCWNDGEEIEMSQFKISTNPPGYAFFVELEENSRKAIHFGSLPEYEQEIYFTASEDSPYSVYGRMVVPVINSELEDNDSYGTIVGGLSLSKKNLDALKNVLVIKQRYKSTEEVLNVVKKISPFELSFDIEGDIDVQRVKSCCGGKKIDAIELTSNLSLNASASFSIPFFKVLFVQTGISIGISIDYDRDRFSPTVYVGNCPVSATIPFNVTGLVTIGAGVGVSGSGLLSFTIYGGGGISFLLDYDMEKNDFVERNHEFFLRLGAKLYYAFAYAEYHYDFKIQ